MRTRPLFIMAVVVLLAVSALSPAQTLNKLANDPPTPVVLSFLLTDGTVIFQGRGWSDWYKLTPNAQGNYQQGTWAEIASLPAGYAPFEYASAVLADGRVLLAGGEYNHGGFALTNQTAIYDPQLDVWTPVGHPKGWRYIGDAPSVLLPDGRFLIGNKLDHRVAVFDPTTLKWKEAVSNGKNDIFAEEGWTLLPDGSVLTVDVRHAPNSEIYTPATGQWASAGSTIVNLRSIQPGLCIPLSNGGKYCPAGEVGPALLLPNGKVFATGSNADDGTNLGHTSTYDPSTGVWTPGPDFPNADNAGDSYAVLLPSGNVLVLGNSGNLYEYDGTNLVQTKQATGSLLTLPTGEVVIGGDPVLIYRSTGSPSPSWAPAITACPQSVTRGSTYQISGTQFNGLSQGAAFGDEFQHSTNYPLVRITNHRTHHVFYARTHGHSTMAVATGSAIVGTNFDVGSAVDTGESSLEVVANGIPSVPVTITVN